MYSRYPNQQKEHRHPPAPMLHRSGVQQLRHPLHHRQTCAQTQRHQNAVQSRVELRVKDHARRQHDRVVSRLAWQEQLVSPQWLHQPPLVVVHVFVALIDLVGRIYHTDLVTVGTVIDVATVHVITVSVFSFTAGTIVIVCSQFCGQFGCNIRRPFNVSVVLLDHLQSGLRAFECSLPLSVHDDDHSTALPAVRQADHARAQVVELRRQEQLVRTQQCAQQERVGVVVFAVRRRGLLILVQIALHELVDGRLENVERLANNRLALGINVVGDLGAQGQVGQRGQRARELRGGDLGGLLEDSVALEDVGNVDPEHQVAAAVLAGRCALAVELVDPAVGINLNSVLQLELVDHHGNACQRLQRDSLGHTVLAAAAVHNVQHSRRGVGVEAVKNNMDAAVRLVGGGGSGRLLAPQRVRAGRRRRNAVGLLPAAIGVRGRSRLLGKDVAETRRRQA
ncbi:uncharacterized protein SPSK_00113 [Sporothrix schenckii 1099-18]|uniref:Uncharacterized protein n=1 Tax=Sporothrix schenckii 1099-18 TaxID=1397361 RepID=A0A0F2M3K9_SPOSC|nr:uncharacterized protein SPSK_00113 [Sporothrix schenckii 1099-18]KJR83704.1 hypothetical protein SPSK_00113 [Sporothrix schenckii 1099-18]